MKIASLLAGILQAFIALSALVSGAVMIASPSGSLMRLPLEMLKSSLFSDFFWSGILLFAVIGLGHVAAAVATFRHFRVRGLAGAVMGLGLMIWIFVQVNMIGGGHGLQFLYFALGTAEVSLAVLILFLRAPRR